MINLYVDSAFRQNLKVGETCPKGYVLPRKSDIQEQSWNIMMLQKWNVFPGVEYQVEDSVVVIMPTKQSSRIYAIS